MGGLSISLVRAQRQGRRAEVFLDREHVGQLAVVALFRRPDFAGAMVAALASGAGVLSIMSLIPMVLERALGIGTVVSAFVLLAWSATSAVTAIAVRWLPYPPRSLLIGGLVGCAVGQFAVYGLKADSSFLRLLPGMLLAGAANGVLNAALGRQAVASVPPNRSAMGSGANNTARYLGSGLGITVATVMVTDAGTGGDAAGLLSGWNVAVLMSVAFSLMGAAAVFLGHDRSRRCLKNMFFELLSGHREG